jgi:glycosyltransferase involved in cell wall biosynthesis
VVDPPRGGVTVPAGDAAALAAAAARLLDDRAARDALSASARVSAERFRWNAVAADHLQFIHRIAEGRPASRSRASR